MNKIENINLLPDTEPDSGDYTGEDGLLYCGKCRKPKEAYFPEGKTLFGLDRHPAECDCQRAQRIEREAAEQQRRHLDTVEDLKRRGRWNISGLAAPAVITPAMSANGQPTPWCISLRTGNTPAVW